MASTIKGLATALKTTLEGLSIFKRVDIVPEEFELNSLMIPAYPLATISYRGGRLEDAEEGKYFIRQLAVTVVDAVPKDAWGEEGVKNAWDLVDAVLNAVFYSQANSLYLAAEIEEVPFVAQRGMKFVAIPLVFFTEIYRDATITDVYPSPADVYDITASGTYTSGGVYLGPKLSVIPVHLVKNFSKQMSTKSGPAGAEARYLGIDGTFEVKLSRPSNAVRDFLFNDAFASGVLKPAVSDVPYGHRVPADWYHKIVIRPLDATHPFLYFPRALVAAVGPLVYGARVKLREAQTITVEAYHDTTDGQPWYYGNPTGFP